MSKRIIPHRVINWAEIVRECLFVDSAVLFAALAFARPVTCSGDDNLERQVYDNLFTEVVRADRAADAAWTGCRTAAEIAARQKYVREKTIAAIGGFPEKTPLNARTTGMVKKDGYVVEKILFESRPKHYVTAHLFLPDGARYSPPYPGVVSPCGHSLSGKLAPWYQRVGVTGAELGLAVLVVDPIDQGERRQRMDPDWKGSVGEHNRIGARAHLLGWNAAQFRVWDGIRALDYLVSRPDIDAGRLGTTGLSGGGTLSSYLNALDGRYGAGAPAGFISTLRDVCDNLGPQDAEQVIWGQAKYGFNHLGIVSLRAPSATMIVATHGDYFPFMGSVDTYENAKKVYSVLGEADRVALMEAPGPHHWYESTRHAAMFWIRRWAAGDKAAWPRDVGPMRHADIGFAYDKSNSGLASDPRDVARVVPSGSTLDLPGSRSVYDIMRDELARLEANRPPLTADAVREASGAKALSSITAAPVAVRESAESGCRRVECVLSRDDDLSPIPFTAVVPAGAKGEAVLLVGDAPAKSLADEISRLVSQGRAVAVAELRGFGATAKARHPYYRSKRPDEEMAMLSIMLGENLAARRAEDAAVAARHFARMTGARRVALVAHGAASIPAAHAYFLERDLFSSFEAKAPPPSWRKSLENPALRLSFADTVYGALRVYDWTDLVRDSQER